ncbi:MAG: hypothetical protein ACI9QL_005214 [Candidatus Omnitrophota bacterium]
MNSMDHVHLGYMGLQGKGWFFPRPDSAVNG